MAFLGTVRRGPALALAALLVLAAAAPAGLRAQTPEELEYQVKAAFLYNFTKFVEWPAEAFANERSPIVLCVAGEDRLGRSLEALVRGETVGGRSLVVDRAAGNYRACHLLFVGQSERERFSQVLDGVQGGDVLTVGEAPGFLEAGGLINFVMEKGKVRFAIHQAAAERSRLKISSKLMRLAINAREGAG
ncbi:MAG TPA: YfiR family protein [Thermoanaerobaculia bacterium]|nr:YfiR family protein [Thermoanaerobaculia bacterium]